MTQKSSTPKSSATARRRSSSTRSSTRSSKGSGALARRPAEDRPFRPTNLQLAYAQTFCEAIASGQPTFDTVLAPKVPTSRSMIPRWRADAAFAAWLDEYARSLFARGMGPILLRAFNLALKGSIKHMEFFARYSGEIDTGELPTPLAGDTLNATYIIAVPRPVGAVPVGAIVGNGQ